MQAGALARAAAIWALRFYRAHIWLVLGLSAVPAIQRPIVILRGDELSPFAVAVGEAVTGLARALLFWFSIRIGIGADPLFASTNRWDLFGAGVSRLKRAFALQFLVLGMAVVMFDFLPNVVIARLVPASQEQLAVVLLVAAKNPTVIAITILWMTGIAHELMRFETRVDPGGASRGPSPE